MAQGMLKKVNLVNTPESWSEIDALIKGVNKEDRFTAQLVAIMAWNLAVDLHEKETSK